MSDRPSDAHSRASVLPTTTISNNIGDQAVNQCEQIFFKHRWMLRRQDGRNDFGIDAEGEIVDQSKVTGKIFKLQIKGSDVVSESGSIAVTIRRSTFNYWRDTPLPVIAVFCDVSRARTYWTLPIAQVPTPNKDNMQLHFDRSQELPQTFTDLHHLLDTWFKGFSDTIFLEVPNFYSVFDGLKAQIGMDFGCEIDSETVREVHLFYRHLLQLRFRLGLSCKHIVSLELWYLRSAAFFGKDRVLMSPIFDEMVLDLKNDYEEAMSLLKGRLLSAPLTFENEQLVNFFRRMEKQPVVLFSRDTQLVSPEQWSHFEKRLSERGALKWKYAKR